MEYALRKDLKRFNKKVNKRFKKVEKSSNINSEEIQKAKVREEEILGKIDVISMEQSKKDIDDELNNIRHRVKRSLGNILRWLYRHQKIFWGLKALFWIMYFICRYFWGITLIEYSANVWGAIQIVLFFWV